MVVTNFRELKVWQKSIDLAKEIYRITSKFPDEEKFGLVSQLRRASVSISSNIAEGSSRGTKKDFAHFVSVALGSLREVQSQLFLAKELGYFEGEIFERLDGELEELARMLIGFRKYLLA